MKFSLKREESVWKAQLVYGCHLRLGAGDRTDDGDGQQEDDAEGYYVAKGPKKKDTKKQEKEARREVCHVVPSRVFV